MLPHRTVLETVALLVGHVRESESETRVPELHRREPVLRTGGSLFSQRAKKPPAVPGRSAAEDFSACPPSMTDGWQNGRPGGDRTRITGLKGRRPGVLDDRAIMKNTRAAGPGPLNAHPGAPHVSHEADASCLRKKNTHRHPSPTARTRSVVWMAAGFDAGVG